jgi:Protein of unknown function (DUF2934)
MTAETGGAKNDAGHAPDPGQKTERRVRMRAYQIWEQEGRPEGRALDHWLRAKRELAPARDPDLELKRLEGELGSLREPGQRT